MNHRAQRDLSLMAFSTGSGVEALSLGALHTLLDHLPGAPFFMKDQQLRYVTANAAMLELCGVGARENIVGCSASEFFPENARRKDEMLDRKVMRTGLPVRDRIDLCTRLRGAPVWLMYGRWSVVDARGGVLGVAGIGRVLEAPDRRHAIYERVALAVDMIHARLGIQLEISELARHAGVSVSKLERDFISLFGLPPRRYITKVRFEAALDMLLVGGTVAEVAHACGYVDQSAFSRRFKATVGVSPTMYRRNVASLNR